MTTFLAVALVLAAPQSASQEATLIASIRAGSFAGDVPLKTVWGVDSVQRSQLDRRLDRLREQRAQIGDLAPKDEGRAVAAEVDLLDAKILCLERLRAALTTLSETGRISVRRFAAGEQPAADEALTRLAALGEQIGKLGLRLEGLAQLAQSGTLVGFIVEQEAVAERARKLGRLAQQEALRLRTARQTLGALADELRADGNATQARFVRRVMGDQAASVDTDYARHVEQVRLLQRRLSATGQGSWSLAARASEIAPLLTRFDAIGTTSAAHALIDRCGQSLQEVARIQDGVRPQADRLRLVHERRVLSILEPFVSEATRERTFSWSHALWIDLGAELWGVRQQLEESARGRLLALRSEGAAALFARWATSGLIVLLLLVVYWMGQRRLSRLVVRAVRGLSHTRAGHRRIGTLVRWAGFWQAVLPALWLGVAGYAVLAVVGFQHVEVLAAETVFRWLILYRLGAQILMGLTRRISRGRPALLSAAPATVELLRLTYGRVGLVLAASAIVDEFSRRMLGVGQLRSLVGSFVLFWVVVWGVWAAYRWRLPLAAAAERRGGERAGRLAQWMRARRVGALLSPAVVAWIALGMCATALRGVLSRRGVLAYLSARTLARRSRHSQSLDSDAVLDEAYTTHFPLEPVPATAGVALVRREEVDSFCSQVNGWRQSRKQGSLLLVGEKGLGKSSLLEQMASKLDGDLRVHRLVIERKVLSDADLVADLAGDFGLPQVTDLGELAQRLSDGPESVVFVDDAHNCFLRTIDGFRGFDALVRLVSETRDRVFWVLVFNTFTWRFLDASRGRLDYFRRVITLQPWSAADLQEVIARRNRAAEREVRFDPMLQEGGRGGEQLDLVEGAEGYFRLLWEESGGNPRVATDLWLRSLRKNSQGDLTVGLLSRDPEHRIANLSDELLFALAAICQHENLTAAELQIVLNCDPGFARFAVHYLREFGALEAKPGPSKRYALAPRHYATTLRLLRARHLLFEEE